MKNTMKIAAMLTLGVIAGATATVLGRPWLQRHFGHWPSEEAKSLVADCAWRHYEEGNLECACVLARMGDAGLAPNQYIVGASHEARNEFGKAVESYRKAADQGFALAMWRLACCYRDGRGVAHDGKQAIRWAERAGEAEYVQAMLMVAQAHAEGSFVPRNEEKAFNWWLRAAKKNSAEAQFRLAYAYETGSGVNRDIDEAARWYDSARINGYDGASDGLARMRQAKRAESWARIKEHLRLLFA